MCKIKKINYLLMVVSVLLSCTPSSKPGDDEMIWLVTQPQVELHKTAITTIFFRHKPDKGSIKVISGNELDIDFNGSEIERGIKYDKANYYYEYEFTAGKLGKSATPVIEIKVNGNTYKSTPGLIEVVEKLKVDSNAIRMVLSSDKNQYKLGDTVLLSLDTYAKFVNYSRFTPDDLVKKGARDALFAIIAEGNVDYEVGIQGFKAYIDANFNVVNFDWNVNDVNKRMSTLENSVYIKNPIFTMKLIPKRKGQYTINSSRFDYKIYPYTDAFKEELLESDKALRTKNKIEVTSNQLNITVSL
ncbi:BatD family protein [Mucilaginibacter auburnensis]|uniref:DUF4249 family protein n=1 Tax=Mucilaginibacter auburnensis TaxID=1457233 RepID=A0A2H9VLQ5_9SPHI|nr:BatD family protein [Mucilaginibacter auburnensis]PJJ79254.1 hypothetical protein CLV57_2381 [Mucilaginibacter auburnensis]